MSKKTAGNERSQRTGPTEALTRIKRCRSQRSELLDLSALGLSECPPEVGQLTWLRQLDLDQNQLSEFPNEVWELTSLEGLNLESNRLRIVPSKIGQLTSLTSLDLESNQLAAIPPEIGQLTELQTLDLDDNQLTDLPSELGNLKSLVGLYVANNRLTSLPEAVCQLTSLTALLLSQNQLEVLPSEIGRLDQLETVLVSDNRLKTLPKGIARLTNLARLTVIHNELTELPREIGALRSLVTLNLEENRLETLPAEIGQLSSLEGLYLEGNQLSNLPREIGQLKRLTILNLGRNRLVALPRELRELISLESLYLQENQLQALPALNQLKSLDSLDVRSNRLAELPGWLSDLPRLQTLLLHHNPDLKLSPTVLGPPPEVNAPPVSARSILDFYFGARTVKSRPLNEVKLILVGRGGAGKTSTVRALRDMPFREGEKSTPGIALSDWVMEVGAGSPITAHMWDFAGQVITHALHQFFFSVRSLYVLVLTGRENSERDDAEYWLRLIKAFGTDEQGSGPPVLVALNKWDVPESRPHLDRGALQERYPFIRGFVEMDCKSGRGVAKLKATLKREVTRLKWVREPFPQEWDAVRRALTSGRQKRPHLTYGEYRRVCAGLGVVDERQQDSLAEVLHNLGAALNYRNDPRLREATVLRPEWLTKNVYALMRCAERQTGVLKQADVAHVLGKRTDPAMHDYLLRIMQRFEIAYAPRASAEIWLVPQALPDTQPKGVESFRQAVDATRLRYTYPALPEGLVARMIVRLHEFIEDVKGKKQQWASGAVLVRESARALIRAETTDRQVMVTVVGPSKARQQLAGLCQAELRDIHQDIPGLDPLEETQVEGEWISTATLEVDERKGQKTGISTRDRGTIQVDPAEPNNAYSDRRARSDDIRKPTVFISYSKSNITQRKRLESELKILKNEGLLNRQWHDRMVDPGDRWDETIQTELSKADVIVILASTAALSTDYITEHEIPKALQLQDSGKAVVVPLVLEACRWEETALGPLNALPEKGKPLNKWRPQSDGWKTVSDGLAVVLKRLMTPRLLAGSDATATSPSVEPRAVREQNAS